MIQLTKHRFINPPPGKLVRKLSLQVFIIFRTFFLTPENAYILVVKCGKIMEVTLGTPDIKSRPMRCQKGLWLQLMCCTPFRLLSLDFGTRKMEYQRSEYRSKDQSCSQSRTLEDKLLR